MAAWMLPTAMLGSTLLASLTNRNSQTGQQEALTATQAKVAELMARQLQSNIGMQNTVLPDLLKGIQARIAQTQNRGRAQMWAPGIFTPRLKKRDPINYGTSGAYSPVDVGAPGLDIIADNRDWAQRDVRGSDRTPVGTLKEQPTSPAPEGKEYRWNTDGTLIKGEDGNPVLFDTSLPPVGGPTKGWR